MAFPNPAETLSPGQALLDAPMPELIRSLGLAIAEAQAALDQNSIQTATALGTTLVEFNDGTNVLKKSLLELGFSPVFYHFTESTLEVSLSLTLKVEESFGFDVDVSITKTQSAAKKATGSVEVAKNEDLADGDSVKIKDTEIKVGTDENMFKRGDTAADTAKNLADAIGKTEALKELVAATVNDAKVTLTAKKEGAAGNLTVTATTSKEGVLKATSMTGGKDAVPAETGSEKKGEGAEGKLKQLVPFAAAINVNYHRKYNFDMSGASKITSKLVSLPGPPEFLDEIKAFYAK